jgi:integrase
VKAAIDQWKAASGVREGALFRSINKTGRIWGTGMTPKVLWEIVREAASRAGIEKLAPHDLRRTCARPSQGVSGLVVDAVLDVLKKAGGDVVVR